MKRKERLPRTAGTYSIRPHSHSPLPYLWQLQYATRTSKNSDDSRAVSDSCYSRKYGSVPRGHECDFYSLIPSCTGDRRRRETGELCSLLYLNSDGKTCVYSANPSEDRVMTKYRVTSPFLYILCGCCYFWHIGESTYTLLMLQGFRHNTGSSLVVFGIICTLYSIPGKKGAVGARG